MLFQVLPVQNLEDLAAQNTYKYGTVDGTALNNLFMASVTIKSLKWSQFPSIFEQGQISNALSFTFNLLFPIEILQNNTNSQCGHCCNCGNVS